MTQPLIVIAAGGTGGHMFPAQALAEAMLAQGWRVRLSTDPRGARYTQGFPPQVEIAVTDSATFARGGVLAKLMVPLRILGGAIAATLRMRQDRPTVVVGFGGYPSIPAMAAARLLRLPRVLHEQNGVLGRVNQLFAKHVHAVACGTWPTELPPGVAGIHCGNPVRGVIAARAGAPYVAPGDHPIEILVTGGSQGARVLSDVVPAAITGLAPDLLRFVRVSHQARPEDIDRVTSHYNSHGVRADVQAFFDDMPDRIANAQLVIARAGASTVADVSVIGRPAIFIPLATAIRDEQTANAAGLLAAGAAHVIQESGLTTDGLTAQIAQILSDPDQATAMAETARKTGIPDATARLIEIIDTVIGAGAKGHET